MANSQERQAITVDVNDPATYFDEELAMLYQYELWFLNGRQLDRQNAPNGSTAPQSSAQTSSNASRRPSLDEQIRARDADSYFNEREEMYYQNEIWYRYKHPRLDGVSTPENAFPQRDAASYFNENDMMYYENEIWYRQGKGPGYPRPITPQDNTYRPTRSILKSPKTPPSYKSTDDGASILTGGEERQIAVTDLNVPKSSSFISGQSAVGVDRRQKITATAETTEREIANTNYTKQTYPAGRDDSGMVAKPPKTADSGYVSDQSSGLKTTARSSYVSGQSALGVEKRPRKVETPTSKSSYPTISESRGADTATVSFAPSDSAKTRTDSLCASTAGTSNICASEPSSTQDRPSVSLPRSYTIDYGSRGTTGSTNASTTSQPGTAKSFRCDDVPGRRSVCSAKQSNVCGKLTCAAEIPVCVESPIIPVDRDKQIGATDKDLSLKDTPVVTDKGKRIISKSKLPVKGAVVSDGGSQRRDMSKMGPDKILGDDRGKAVSPTSRDLPEKRPTVPTREKDTRGKDEDLPTTLPTDKHSELCAAGIHVISDSPEKRSTLGAEKDKELVARGKGEKEDLPATVPPVLTDRKIERIPEKEKKIDIPPKRSTMGADRDKELGARDKGEKEDLPATVPPVLTDRKIERIPEKEEKIEIPPKRSTMGADKDKELGARDKGEKEDLPPTVPPVLTDRKIERIPEKEKKIDIPPKRSTMGADRDKELGARGKDEKGDFPALVAPVVPDSKIECAAEKDKPSDIPAKKSAISADREKELDARDKNEKGDLPALLPPVLPGRKIERIPEKEKEIEIPAKTSTMGAKDEKAEMPVTVPPVISDKKIDAIEKDKKSDFPDKKSTGQMGTDRGKDEKAELPAKVPPVISDKKIDAIEKDKKSDFPAKKSTVSADRGKDEKAELPVIVPPVLAEKKIERIPEKDKKSDFPAKKSTLGAEREKELDARGKDEKRELPVIIPPVVPDRKIEKEPAKERERERETAKPRDESKYVPVIGPTVTSGRDQVTDTKPKDQTKDVPPQKPSSPARETAKISAPIIAEKTQRDDLPEKAKPEPKPIKTGLDKSTQTPREKSTQTPPELEREISQTDSRPQSPPERVAPIPTTPVVVTGAKDINKDKLKGSPSPSQGDSGAGKIQYKPETKTPPPKKAKPAPKKSAKAEPKQKPIKETASLSKGNVKPSSDYGHEFGARGGSKEGLPEPKYKGDAIPETSVATTTAVGIPKKGKAKTARGKPTTAAEAPDGQSYIYDTEQPSAGSAAAPTKAESAPPKKENVPQKQSDTGSDRPVGGRKDERSRYIAETGTLVPPKTSSTQSANVPQKKEYDSRPTAAEEPRRTEPVASPRDSRKQASKIPSKKRAEPRAKVQEKEYTSREERAAPQKKFYAPGPSEADDSGRVVAAVPPGGAKQDEYAPEKDTSQPSRSTGSPKSSAFGAAPSKKLKKEPVGFTRDTGSTSRRSFDDTSSKKRKRDSGREPSPQRGRPVSNPFGYRSESQMALDQRRADEKRDRAARRRESSKSLPGSSRTSRRRGSPSSSTSSLDSRVLPHYERGFAGPRCNSGISTPPGRGGRGGCFGWF